MTAREVTMTFTFRVDSEVTDADIAALRAAAAAQLDDPENAYVSEHTGVVDDVVSVKDVDDFHDALIALGKKDDLTLQVIPTGGGCTALGWSEDVSDDLHALVLTDGEGEPPSDGFTHITEITWNRHAQGSSETTLFQGCALLEDVYALISDRIRSVRDGRINA